MTTIYSARWLLPISSAPIANGALLIATDRILAVGEREQLHLANPKATLRDFGDALIIPGLINSHSHLELTAMRGFLDAVESDFPSWLKKLTMARLERLTPDDLYVSAAWGACEAARAGVTCVGDSSDAAEASMTALLDVGLRGIVFQESFGPDPQLVAENFKALREKMGRLRDIETTLVRAGVSPHAPYTVCGEQLELIAELALSEKLPLMMHAAESLAEQELLRNGCGPFAEGLARRGIEWRTPGLSTIKYLQRHNVLQARPLLAHCVHVDLEDIEILRNSSASVAHCPRSNAKLGHARAPFAAFLEHGIAVGLGSDSVASNNSCDLLSEGRFAILSARAGVAAAARTLQAEDVIRVATLGGSRALGLEGRVGELRVGMQADFAAVSMAGLHQIPSYDPVGTLIFASSAHDVIATVVAGREVYADARVQTVDEVRLRARMKEIEQKLAA